jgi:hypothetical protein
MIGGYKGARTKRPWFMGEPRSTDRASLWLLVKLGGNFLGFVVLGGLLAFVVLVILFFLGFPVEGLLA